MRTRILLFLASLILVPTLTFVVIMLAKGYRPNFKDGQITPTGLLAATSLPDGAEIFIGGVLKTATDSTINLAPGEYQVEIKKDGYSVWTKKLQVEAEVVTRAHALLFPTVPSLKAITSNGALNPSLSPDNNRIAFLINELNTTNLYTLDLSESPLGSINRDAKLVTSLPKENYLLSWSPDGKQIISQSVPAAPIKGTSSASGSAYLVSLDKNTATNITNRLIAVRNQWQEIQETINAPKLSTLPLVLKDIMASSAASLTWSARENKILYTATASATIPDGLIRPLPGSNSQTENRSIEPGNMYVYDIEEDKNFLVGKTSGPSLSWFPTSSHLVQVEKNKVTIMEYDGGNPTVVYAGPMEAGFAFPYPSSKQMLILTNLNPAIATTPNLYAVSLR